MNCRPFGPTADDFAWAVGIENTFVPQTRSGHRRLDEYELMDHYGHWREDIDRVAELGVKMLRYGIPWYRVNPAPGVFDWSWTDEVLDYLVGTKGLTPIIDLMHYGTPLWLDNHFVNASYPRRVAEYASAFAERYRSIVRHYTPAERAGGDGRVLRPGRAMAAVPEGGRRLRQGPPGPDAGDGADVRGAPGGPARRGPGPRRGRRDRVRRLDRPGRPGGGLAGPAAPAARPGLRPGQARPPVPRLAPGPRRDRVRAPRAGRPGRPAGTCSA